MYVLLCGIIVVFISFVFFTREKNKNSPPGLRGWPIIGSLPDFKKPFLEEIEKNRKRFGDVFYWRMGARDVVFLCEPKVIRKAFAHPDFTDRPPNHFTIDTWSSFKKIGIANSIGITWQTHRRFALRQLRDSGFGKSTVEDIALIEVENLIEDIKKNHLLKPTDLGCSIHVATLNIIWKMVADIRFQRDDEDLNHFMTSLMSLLKQIQGLVNIFDIFPWLVPITPSFVMDKIGFKDLQKSRNNVLDYIISIVEERKTTLDKDNPCGLIDAYLLEIQNSPEQDATFNEEALLISLGDLFFAGTDTTSSTLKWLFQHMACYPEIQKKLQKEIDSIIPLDKYVTLEDRVRMPYTEATIYEVLRVTSLAPLGLLHAAGNDTEIENFFIPKGTVIAPFFYGCHMDPRYWEKPTEFYPEHFLDKDGNFTNKNEAFMPFSCGRRSCLGESLAKTELFLFTASVLQKFSFDLAEGESNVIENSTSQIFRTPKPLKLVIKERNK